MEIANKELTAIVKSMRKNLSSQHKVEVPSSALRAVLLQAMGENPHAFAKKSASDTSAVRKLETLVKEAPKFFALDSFDGEKREWLERAGLIGDADSRSQESRRTMYLGYDDLNCLQCLAFDSDRSYSFELERPLMDVCVRAMSAQIPSIRRYGLPIYLEDPKEFFHRTIRCDIRLDARPQYEDLGDDSGDSCELEVSCSDADWETMVQFALNQSASFKNDVSEWVGLHYSVNFDAESSPRKVEWAVRYVNGLQS